MKHPLTKILIISSFLLYSLTLFLTQYSFTGFWIDFFVYFTLLGLLIFFVLRSRFVKPWIHSTLGCGLVILLTFTIIISGYVFFYYKIRQLSKTISLETQIINGRTFHPYFQPNGTAWGQGFGTFWISESPKHLSIVENIVYYEEGTGYDMRNSYFEDTPIKEIIRTTIKNEVINKQN